MVSTFSPNLNLELVGRGDQVGVWDTPENSDWSVLDSAVGAVTVISLNNANVVLSAAQFRSKTIIFNSTLTGSVTITFPTSFSKSYEIYNQCTGSSAFTITMGTTAASAAVICAPPGELVDVINYGLAAGGGSMSYVNLGRIGSYWDYAGSSVPAWVSGCSFQPYLNCDGTAFSSGVFPALAAILGGTTLPDSRGRSRFALDQGAARISSAPPGFSGGSVGSGGGAQATTIGTSNLPPYTPAGSAITTDSVAHGPTNGSAVAGGSQLTTTVAGAAYGTLTSNFTGTPQGGVSALLTNLPPAYIGGLTLIRAG